MEREEQEDRRIKTYISNFDGEMDGGIPEGNIVLLCGLPGTMKSTLAFNLLYRNARHGVNGLYVTLEQSGPSLRKQMAKVSLDPNSVQEHLRVLDLSQLRAQLHEQGRQDWLQIIKSYVETLKNDMDFQLLVIDSLPVVEVLAKFNDPRDDYFHLFEWFRELDVTTLLISETESDRGRFGIFGEDFLSDGIIHVKMEKIGEVNIQRRIRCVKMRGTNHSPHYQALLFTDGIFQATGVITDVE